MARRKSRFGESDITGVALRVISRGSFSAEKKVNMPCALTGQMVPHVTDEAEPRASVEMRGSREACDALK